MTGPHRGNHRAVARRCRSFWGLALLVGTSFCVENSNAFSPIKAIDAVISFARHGHVDLEAPSVTKKKKTKRSKKSTKSDVSSDPITQPKRKSKKKKKRRSVTLNVEPDEKPAQSLPDPPPTKKRKVRKKKRMGFGLDDIPATPTEAPVRRRSSKKKKKSSKSRIAVVPEVEVSDRPKRRTKGSKRKRQTPVVNDVDQKVEPRKKKKKSKKKRRVDRPAFVHESVLQEVPERPAEPNVAGDVESSPDKVVRTKKSKKAKASKKKKSKRRSHEPTAEITTVGETETVTEAAPASPMLSTTLAGSSSAPAAIGGEGNEITNSEKGGETPNAYAQEGGVSMVDTSLGDDVTLPTAEIASPVAEADDPIESATGNLTDKATENNDADDLGSQSATRTTETLEPSEDGERAVEDATTEEIPTEPVLNTSTTTDVTVGSVSPNTSTNVTNESVENAITTPICNDVSLPEAANEAISNFTADAAGEGIMATADREANTSLSGKIASVEGQETHRKDVAESEVREDKEDTEDGSTTDDDSSTDDSTTDSDDDVPDDGGEANLTSHLSPVETPDSEVPEVALDLDEKPDNPSVTDANVLEDPAGVNDGSKKLNSTHVGAVGDDVHRVDTDQDAVQSVDGSGCAEKKRQEGITDDRFTHLDIVGGHVSTLETDDDEDDSDDESDVEEDTAVSDEEAANSDENDEQQGKDDLEAVEGADELDAGKDIPVEDISTPDVIEHGPSTQDESTPTPDAATETAATAAKQSDEAPIPVDECIDPSSLDTMKDSANDLNCGVVTWNLAEESPSEEEASFLKRFRGQDLVLICGQECENIKPRRSEGRRSREFRRLMIKYLGSQYIPLALHMLGGIQFGLFCKRSLLEDVEVVSLADVTCGIGNVFHNKGAIAAYVILRNRENSTPLRLLLVTAHMAAHVKNTEARNADFWRIVSELEAQAPHRFLPPRSSRDQEDDCTGEYLLDSMDRIIFCGDLNYRIDLPREIVEHTVQLMESPEHRNSVMFLDLLKHDQLRTVMAEQRAFPGFAEGQITFSPTFKYDKGTSDFDTSHKQRIPAWTDRILFKPSATRVLEYGSVPTACHSDHRPVFALLRMSRRQQLSSGLPKRKRRKKKKARVVRD